MKPSRAWFLPLALLTLAAAQPATWILAQEATPVPSPSPTPSASPASAPYRLDDFDPSAKTGYYTSRILKFLDHWPPPTLTITDTDRTIYTRAIRTPDHPRIVGTIKHFNIQAPIERVAQVTEDFENYPKIWEGLKSVKIESRDRNRVVTAWVRGAPAFFMPKLHYRLVYVIDRSQPGRIVYRQQLIDGNALSSSDGVVVLEKRGDNLTRLSIVTFFDPDAGPFRALVDGVIWNRSIENSFKDDTAFRAHIEHPDWDKDRLSDEADKAWDQNKIDPILYTDLLKFD